MMSESFALTIVTRNGNRVWEHGPIQPFYAFMLRTKLDQNPFFFTGHKNVNKPRSGASRTVYGPIFLPSIRLLSAFFSFFCQDVSKARSNCAIIGCNLSKKRKLTLYKTQNGESNYVGHKLFFNFYQELPTCTKPWGQTSNTIELASCLVHVLCDFKAT